MRDPNKQIDFFDQNEELTEGGKKHLERALSDFESGSEMTEKIVGILDSGGSLHDVLANPELKNSLLAKAYPEIEGNPEREQKLFEFIIDSLQHKIMLGNPGGEDLTTLKLKFEEAQNKLSELDNQTPKMLEDLEKKVANCQKAIKLSKEKYPNLIDTKELEETIKKIEELQEKKEGKRGKTIELLESKVLKGTDSVKNRLQNFVYKVKGTSLLQLTKEAESISAYLESLVKLKNSLGTLAPAGQNDELETVLVTLRDNFTNSIKNPLDVAATTAPTTILDGTGQRDFSNRIATFFEADEIAEVFKKATKSNEGYFSSAVSLDQLKKLGEKLDKQTKTLETRTKTVEDAYTDINKDREAHSSKLEKYEKDSEKAALKTDNDLYKEQYKEALKLNMADVSSKDLPFRDNIESIRRVFKNNAYAYGFDKEYEKLVRANSSSTDKMIAGLNSLQELLKEKNVDFKQEIVWKNKEGKDEKKTVEEAWQEIVNSPYTAEKKQERIDTLTKLREEITKLEEDLVKSLESNNEEDFSVAEKRLREAYQEVAAKENEYMGYSKASKIRKETMTRVGEMDNLYDKNNGKADGNLKKLIEDLKKGNRTLNKDKEKLIKDIEKETDPEEKVVLELKLREVMKQLSDYQTIMTQKEDEILVYQKSVPLVSKKEQNEKEAKLKVALKEKNREGYCGLFRYWFLPRRYTRFMARNLRMPTMPLAGGGMHLTTIGALAGHTRERNEKAAKLLTKMRYEPTQPHGKYTRFITEWWEDRFKRSIFREQKIISQYSQKIENANQTWGKTSNAQAKLEQYKEKYNHLLKDGQEIIHIDQIVLRREIADLQQNVLGAQARGSTSEVTLYTAQLKEKTKKLEDLEKNLLGNKKAIEELSKPEFLKGLGETREVAETRLNTSKEKDEKMVKDFVGKLRENGLDENIYPDSKIKEEFKDWRQILKYSFIPLNIEKNICKPFFEFVKSRIGDKITFKPKDFKTLITVLINNQDQGLFTPTTFRRDFKALQALGSWSGLSTINTLREYLDHRELDYNLRTI